MPDLLAHAFLAYSLGTLLAWRYDWLTPQYVTVVMAGAFIPDLAKLGLLISDAQVAAVLGIPFEWFGLHTAGGVAVCVLIGAVIVPQTVRPRVAALLALGASSHLVADAFLRTAHGHSYPLLWPLTATAPPTPGLYLSSDPWVAGLTGSVALLCWLGSRRRRDSNDTDNRDS